MLFMSQTRASDIVSPYESMWEKLQVEERNNEDSKQADIPGSQEKGCMVPLRMFDLSRVFSWTATQRTCMGLTSALCTYVCSLVLLWAS